MKFKPSMRTWLLLGGAAFVYMQLKNGLPAIPGNGEDNQTPGGLQNWIGNFPWLGEKVDQGGDAWKTARTFIANMLSVEESEVEYVDILPIQGASNQEIIGQHYGYRVTVKAQGQTYQVIVDNDGNASLG